MAKEKADNSGVEFEDGDSYTFNMKETKEDSGFAPLPKGNYLCTLESVEFKLSKSSGAPMLNFVWAVAEGEFAEKNRKIFDFLSFKEGQQGRVKKWLNRVAPELAELEDFNPKKVADQGLLVGKQAKLKVDIEDGTDEYPGAKNRVKDVFAPGAASAGGGSFTM
jgi:hypothetical protein